MEFLREIAHLRFRTNTFGAVFRIRHALAFAIHKYFNDIGFYYLHSPIITASDAEGAGEMFRVSTLDLIHPPMKEDGKEVDFTEDFFGQTHQPHCFGTARGRAGSPGPGWGIYLRTYFQGRKFKYAESPGRILDDRTRSGL